MTTKKMAVFVEGQTEQLFLKEFIDQIAGQGNIGFECHSSGSILRLQQLKEVHGERHKVLIYDCRGDEVVKSVLLEHRPNLVRAGYSMILGLRDLYPKSLAELGRVKARLSYGVPTADVPTHMLLAVTEIEAWFLQEATHYAKIDSSLDIKTFKAKFGFDPLTDCAESVLAPAQLLHSIYSSAGKAYKKTRNHVQRTIGALDYEDLYLTCAGKMPHLSEFVGHIENFLAPDFSDVA